MPTIFTQTPIEAHIIACFLKAQIALAQVMKGTPIFRLLLLFMVGWAIVIQFARMAAHHHRAGSAFLNIIYRIAMMFLALGLLGYQVQNIRWSSPTKAWADYSGVQSDGRYAQTINTDTPGLWSYTMLFESLNGLAQTMSNAAASAFNDPAFNTDPTTVLQQVARVGASALGSDVSTQLNSLFANCSRSAPTNSATVVGSFNTVGDLLDLTKTFSDGSTCAQMYAAFQGGAAARANQLSQNYPEYTWASMTGWLSQKLGMSTAQADQALKNQMLAHALTHQLQVQQGITDPSSRNFMTFANGQANSAATMSNGLDRTVEEVSRDGFWGTVGMTIWSRAADFFGGRDPRQVARKAEAANSFNTIAPLIPAARALLQGIWALLFVFAAYSVGFGTWRGLWAWGLGQATLCLYTPLAALGYKVATYFMQESNFAQTIQSSAADPLMISGATVLDNELGNIQTIYLCFEVGAFVVLALGALSCFKPLANITGAATAAAAGAASGWMLGRSASSPGPAGSTVVNVNNVPSWVPPVSGGFSSPPPSGGAPAPGVASAPGMITPGASPPPTWGQTT